jgi:hypothetical protein
MKYEILHNTIADGWANVWLDGDNPVYFDTYDQAWDELIDFLEDMREAYQRGDLETPYLPEEFKVRKVTK